MHHALYNALEPLYERSYIRDTYACLSGRGTLAAVRRYEEFVRQLGGRGYTPAVTAAVQVLVTAETTQEESSQLAA